MTAGIDFNDVLNILEGEEFEERPVDIETFCYSEDYLAFKPEVRLSDYQLTLVKASTQIYKRTTLHNLYGFEEGEKRWKQTCTEVIFQLGKGSGKDFSSTIAVAYIVYLLLCLKDPARYYNKPSGNNIDILNVAINSEQAHNVFFSGFSQLIEGSPWFQGRYAPPSRGVYHFDKNINVYSGHSEREAWEGYNFLYVVLDEIAGFAIESTSGNVQAKTAEALYLAYRDAVDSRFEEFGKLVLLSFPRYKGDYIQQAYDRVIASKEVVIRSHTFKIDKDLPDGTEGNEFTIEWEEDHITAYTMPGIFALKRPSWEVNPTKNIDMYMKSFYSNPSNALAKFACMPPDAIDAFFKDKQKVEKAFSLAPRMELDGTFHESFVPDPTKRYFLHVDLARVHDHCAVAMAHVEKWEQVQIGRNNDGTAKLSEPSPVIVVDCIRFWTPTKEKNVDFSDVREFILSLKRRGFDINLTTFDRWESQDTIDYLRSKGMRSEKLSVAKKHYEDFAMVVAEERVFGPHVQLLIDEMLQLMIMKNDKVDHPRKGSKDLADAVCGAIYNAIAHTPRNLYEDVQIKTLESVRKELRALDDSIREEQRKGGVIKAPKRDMPKELEEHLLKLQVI